MICGKAMLLLLLMPLRQVVFHSELKNLILKIVLHSSYIILKSSLKHLLSNQVFYNINLIGPNIIIH